VGIIERPHASQLGSWRLLAARSRCGMYALNEFIPQIPQSAVDGCVLLACIPSQAAIRHEPALPQRKTEAVMMSMVVVEGG